ncbi:MULTISPECIES: cytochrome P450 [Streptomyces]|uniref:cytochrome P450 n=1 Tax=Streptomyces TaxID=1883 RepID=UPI001E2F80EF|nr:MULTISPECIES: cytochrome P450 [Streptomyces]UFQ14057.1 cytochrome P450 [Streptomyces huasconensis]WCL83656.1 cytochrome P450 [Streptomyces sp. JCM 35825]
MSALRPSPADAPPQLSAGLDLSDPALHAEHDLTEVWRTLRAERPVHWQPARHGRPGFWVVTRYDDVSAVYRDARAFRSDRGNVLDTLLAGGDSAGGSMLAVTDGARHARLRAALMKSFSPRALDGVVRSVRTATRGLLEDALERGTCDFAQDVAARIPLRAICDLLDVPEADRGEILALTSAALGSEHADAGPDEAWLARNDILLYFADLAARRRAEPGDDVISVLAACRPGGLPLTDEEIVLNCYSLILGGDETTRLSMIGGVEALLAHPEQWRRLRSGEVTTRSAVEEVLRWTTPALHAGRTAAVDVTLRGRSIAAGDIVTVWNASANFDERVFDRPGRFDLSRTPNKHMSFAYGSHFCLGAYLARVEIETLLDGLRTLVAEMEATGPSSPVYSNFLSGSARLPLSWSRV